MNGSEHDLACRHVVINFLISVLTLIIYNIWFRGGDLNGF